MNNRLQLSHNSCYRCFIREAHVAPSRVRPPKPGFSALARSAVLRLGASQARVFSQTVAQVPTHEAGYWCKSLTAASQLESYESTLIDSHARMEFQLRRWRLFHHIVRLLTSCRKAPLIPWYSGKRCRSTSDFIPSELYWLMYCLSPSTCHFLIRHPCGPMIK